MPPGGAYAKLSSMMDRFTSRELGDELIIHDAVTDSVHVLSRTARLVYELGRAGKRVDEIVASLQMTFLVPPSRDLSADVSDCLKQLRDKGLLD